MSPCEPATTPLVRASFSASANIAGVPMCAAGPSFFQVTRSASRPRIAAQVLLATTATPLEIFTTSLTPGTLRAPASSTLATVPPKVGAFSTFAYTIPGTTTSMP